MRIGIAADHGGFELKGLLAKAMLAVFHNSGYVVSTEFDGDVYNIHYDLN